MIDNCCFENCGANDSASEGDIGSEGGCLTLKGETSAEARFGTIVQNCTFAAGSITEVPMVLFGHGGILRDCTFQDWQWTGTHKSRRFMISKYSGKPVAIINPTLINCGGEGALAFSENSATTAAINWQAVNFDNNRTAIFRGVNFRHGCTNELGQHLANQ